MRHQIEPLEDVARAKVNLTLHVGAVDTYGYHPLHSLVVFADIGDGVSAKPSDNFSLKSSGPFAKKMPPDRENLILKTSHALSQGNDIPVSLAYHLKKILPIASGIGGGSADAAAALRLLARANHVSWDEHAESFVAFGADIPVCFLSRTCLMQGIGEDILPLPNMGRVPAILVNPGVSVSTQEMFVKFDHVGVPSAFSLSSGTVLDMAKSGRNDLQPIAVTEYPIIGKTIREIERSSGCQLARMSGSGATCFGLFETLKMAKAAAKTIRAKHPKWWIKSVWLGDKQ